jgi:hypothetical protein
MISPEHERYLWLRDGKSRRAGWCGSAPYVISPNKSRLYAIAKLRALHLDLEIDYDILIDKVEDLHLHNEIVEREIMIQPDKNSEEYNNCLHVLAAIELGWTMQRFSQTMAYSTHD